MSAARARLASYVPQITREAVALGTMSHRDAERIELVNGSESNGIAYRLMIVGENGGLTSPAFIPGGFLGRTAPEAERTLQVVLDTLRGVAYMQRENRAGRGVHA